jgi:NAD(P)H dehydrogenase (quinone)
MHCHSSGPFWLQWRNLVWIFFRLAGYRFQFYLVTDIQSHINKIQIGNIMSTNDTILVTGASGHFGRSVLNHLINTYKVPASQIIAVTRKPKSLAGLAKQGVTVRTADFDSPDLAKAFAGGKRLLIISTDSLEGGRRLAQHVKAVEAARQAGVTHIVYTSMPKPDAASPILFAGDHRGTEEAIAGSGIAHTILRNSWYMENLAMSVPSALATGKWFTAAGTGKISHTARDDQARTAAAVLASGTMDSKTYTLTGPQALSTDETAMIASEALGKPIEVVHVTAEQLAQGMAGSGLPELLIPMVVSFDVNTAQNRMDMVTDAVQSLSGAAPQNLRDWFKSNKAMFLA